MTCDSAEHLVNKNIRLFTLYRVISRLYFHLPVLFLYLFTIELGIYWVIFLFIIYGFSTTFTGGLNKKLLNQFSHKQVIAIGEMLKCISLIMLLIGTQQASVYLPIIFISQFIGGTGFSIALTTDSSLLRDIASKSKRENLFSIIQAKTQSKMFIATLVAGFLGSILYDYQPNWPFFLSIVASGVSTFIILLVIDSPNQSQQTNQISTTSEKIVLTKNQSLWTYFYSISRSFTIAPFIAFFPYFFIHLNVEPLLFGLVLGLFTLSAYFSSSYSNFLIKLFGISNILICILLFMLMSFLMLGISAVLATNFGIDYFISGLISISLLGFGSGAIRPIVMANLDLKGLNSIGQIYIFTLMEKNFGILNGTLLAIGSYILVISNIQNLMLCMALSYIITILLLAIVYTTETSNK